MLDLEAAAGAWWCSLAEDRRRSGVGSCGDPEVSGVDVTVSLCCDPRVSMLDGFSLVVKSGIGIVAMKLLGSFSREGEEPGGTIFYIPWVVTKAIAESTS